VHGPAHPAHPPKSNPPASRFSLRSFVLGVAVVVGAQLLLRWLLRTAWFRGAVDQARLLAGLPDGLWWRGGPQDREPRRVAGGPYGWDDEVYSLEETSSGEADGDGGGAADSAAEAAEEAEPAAGYGAFGDAFGVGRRRRQLLLTQKAERARRREQDIAARMIESDDGESVEWVNMCIRKSWRVFQRGLERWFTDLLQPVFDSLLEVRARAAGSRLEAERKPAGSRADAGVGAPRALAGSDRPGRGAGA
jgi:hypothetical protein